MIKDILKNSNKYYDLHPFFQQGFDFLINNDLENIPLGKYIVNENVYVNIDEYETKISNKIEAHREYIDIQYIISGQESIGVAKLDKLNILEEYNKKNDIAFYDGKCEFVDLNKSEFLILYPSDAHLPCQILNEKTKIKKAVVKVKIDY